ncbi:RES family NAD+ phosphorylase [Bacillus sp. FSL H8-0547]
MKIRLDIPINKRDDRFFKPENIEKKINKLRSLDLKRADDGDIISALREIISYQPDPNVGHSVINMVSSSRLIMKGSTLYRVRICGDTLEEMKIESDAWNPPVKFANTGRVNKNGESVLYVAEDMETAMKEMKMQYDQYFWLIVYDVKKDINVIDIGEYAHENDEFDPAYRVIADFLKQEFTREVETGMEHEYVVSNLIAKFFYPYTTYKFDGWSYPSVADKGSKCLCLAPHKARKKMKINYAIKYLMLKDEIIPVHIAYLNKVRRFEYHTLT